MGLLDSDFGKLLFGHTTMMKDREQARQNKVNTGLYKGLLGDPGTMTQPGTIQPVTETTDQFGNVTMTGGQETPAQYEGRTPGLLTGDRTREQFNTQIGAIPAYKDMSTNLQMQSMRDANSMRQFGMLSANDIRNQQNADRDFYTEQLQTSNDVIKAGEALYNSMPKFENGVVDVGSFNSSTDNQLIMSYAKAMNPGEAVAVDERGNIVAASWMPAGLQKIISMAQGSAELSNTVRSQMLYQYDKILQLNRQENAALVQKARGANIQYGAGQNRMPFNRPGQNFSGGGEYIPGGFNRRTSNPQGAQSDDSGINWK